MATRRERAIERATRERGYPPTAGQAIDAYEAELAADLQSDETMDRLIQEYWPIVPLTNTEIIQSRDAMRAALRSVLEE